MYMSIPQSFSFLRIISYAYAQLQAHCQWKVTQPKELKTSMRLFIRPSYLLRRLTGLSRMISSSSSLPSPSCLFLSEKMFSCLIRACSFMEVMFSSLTLTFSSFMRAGFECFPILGRVYEIKSVFGNSGGHCMQSRIDQADYSS